MFPRNKPPEVEAIHPADGLHQVLSQVDIAILCVPLNAQTHHLIDAAAFAKVKPGAILINVARGPVVDEAAMVNALTLGQLSAAGLDVTEVEPLSESSPLWEMSNVIITPHVGAQSAKRVDDSTELFCDNLERYLRGERLRNVVDKELGFPRPSSD
jgi:D-3-phosphoglycerate dehydrogenase